MSFLFLGMWIWLIYVMIKYNELVDYECLSNVNLINY